LSEVFSYYMKDPCVRNEIGCEQLSIATRNAVVRLQGFVLQSC